MICVVVFMSLASFTGTHRRVLRRHGIVGKKERQIYINIYIQYIVWFRTVCRREISNEILQSQHGLLRLCKPIKRSAIKGTIRKERCDTYDLHIQDIYKINI